MTETDRIVNVVLSRYEAQLLPTKDYTLATVITEREWGWKDVAVAAAILVPALTGIALMLIGAHTVWGWL